MYLRCYARKNGDNYVIMGDTQLIGRREFNRKELGDVDTPFCEVKLSATTNSQIISVDPIEQSSIHPLAIKAANDHNESLQISYTTRRAAATPQEMRESLQDVKDRIDLYGDEFVKAFAELLSRYPLKVVNVTPEGQPEGLNCVYRLVEKGK